MLTFTFFTAFAVFTIFGWVVIEEDKGMAGIIFAMATIALAISVIAMGGLPQPMGAGAARAMLAFGAVYLAIYGIMFTMLISLLANGWQMLYVLIPFASTTASAVVARIVLGS
ncbi:MAG: hypothetical protein WAX89_04025 [Alphaproteobacteria bacterium]